MSLNSIDAFYRDTETMLDELVQNSPVTGTFLGDHRYDDRLANYTPQAVREQRVRIGEWCDKVAAYDTAGWPVDAEIDLTLMHQILKSFIREHDQFRFHERNPGTGPDECLGGVYSLIIRDFAPLAQRMLSILGRLRETPRVLQESRALIIPHAVPKIWAEIAIESARRGVGLFAAFVPMLAESTPDLKDDILAASQAAASALNDYAAWVEEQVLPHAQGDFAAGKALFDEILRENHMVDYDSDQLLATGWKLIEGTSRQMEALAAEMDPSKTVKELLEATKNDHPPADKLLDTYREWMAAARQFVLDHEIASIPEGESIRIEPTPEFLRPLIPYAAYNMPGIFEVVQEGIFIVTPVEEGASPEAAERKLRGHPNSDIPVTALHEAYPGHHLQLVTANKLTSTPRKLGAYLSTLFIEGWAFYCEELMEQLGFIDQPIQKLSRLQAQLWRACRIVIDVSLHTGKMSVGEAVNFLVERAGLEPDDARAEVNRYTTSPTQPQSYLMGKLQILELVDEYKRRFPEASMRQMHDDILNSGSLPPRLMHQRLFGES
jgi:uncharacterized protein (DUF885 family)